MGLGGLVCVGVGCWLGGCVVGWHLAADVAQAPVPEPDDEPCVRSIVDGSRLNPDQCFGFFPRLQQRIFVTRACYLLQAKHMFYNQNNFKART